MGTLSDHGAHSPHQGEHSDFFRNIFEVPHDIFIRHATSYEAVVPRPTQRSGEVILSSGKGAPSNVATHTSINGGKKRREQRLQGAATMTGHDDGNNGEAGGSDVRCSSTAACSDKRQARPPMDHFKRLLEEACPNHAYPVRHKLKDCSMMISFMTSGSLTWSVELDKGPNGSDMMPFPGENIVPRWEQYGAFP
jgi:hypothetical protein